ncbi:MAG: radical SAM protein, partial [Myxococcales bacterium]|nr:radical SAM protein [Myxococcales bacterium]
VSIITKSALVARDTDLLAELARLDLSEVNISIAFDDDDDARRVEPWASKPSRRFEAVAALANAGVPVGVGLAPLIPGINDDAIPRILSRSKAAGATRAWMTLLRLPSEVEQVFLERIDEAFPLRGDRVRRAIDEMRGGDRRDENRFGKRFTGRGPRWDAAEQLFRIHATRLGLMGAHVGEEMPFIRPESSAPSPPPRGRQLKLF